MRYAFNSPIQGTTEIVTMLMAWVAYAGMGYTLLKGQHMQLGAVYDRLHGRIKHIFSFFIYLLATILFVVMAEFQDWQQSEMDGWEQEMLDNGVTISTLSDEAKAEWAETALGYQDTLQTWIDEVTALGYDGAGIMSAYLQAGEELGYEWHFDTTPYIQ